MQADSERDDPRDQRTQNEDKSKQAKQAGYAEPKAAADLCGNIRRELGTCQPQLFLKKLRQVAYDVRQRFRQTWLVEPLMSHRSPRRVDCYPACLPRFATSKRVNCS